MATPARKLGAAPDVLGCPGDDPGSLPSCRHGFRKFLVMCPIRTPPAAWAAKSSPWGKFFVCTLACGIPRPGQNFLDRGEGCEESHSHALDAPVRPSV